MASAQPQSASTTDPVTKTEDPKPAPKLSDHDFKMYNRLAVHMDALHENFRRTWNLLWAYATTGQRPHGLTPGQLARAGLDFADRLAMHHDIEERHVFPELARRMPEFDPRRGGGDGDGDGGELVAQHRTIHAGLDGLRAYLEGVQRRGGGGDEALTAGALRESMEAWGGVLWAHLDDEVRALGGRNMARYWTKEEVMRMRW
ncbi:hypothetical protein G3M48_006257 [Beauveria asiatica]|uniref:Hemerythrin-like domain-containing protein n=1 Tax=Beauveria asiatica TaxID=1069075 RepID=A0AAW0RQH4_9HYPO